MKYKKIKIMKIKILLLLAVVTFFSSCESDNTLETAITEADLIGTWNVIEQNLDGNVVFVDNGQTQTASYNAFAKNLNMTLNFGDNPKKVSAQGNYTLVATVNYNGQAETDEEFVEAISDPAENPTWALNGNNITLSNDYSLPQNLIVESYDDQKLKLKAEIDETENDNGLSITIKSNIYFVLEK